MALASGCEDPRDRTVPEPAMSAATADAAAASDGPPADVLADPDARLPLDVGLGPDVAHPDVVIRAPDGPPPDDAPRAPDVAVDAADAAQPDARPDSSPDVLLPELTCDDGVRNGDETALDCGGSCPPCEIGQACREDDDCVGFLSCRGGWCMGRRCREDGVLNGAEVDVDCGAACAHACEVGAQCVGYSDCVGEARCRRGRCARPSCEDGVQNQRESDRDCGGPCAPCDDGAGCLRGEDCQSSSCVDDLCRPPACDDWVQNGDEEDVDCGGACCACIVCGPAAPEACNMVDDDRDGRVDEGVLRQPECIDNLVPALPLRTDESCVEIGRAHV